MDSINAGNLSIALDALRQERMELLRFLQALTSEEWELPTECPAYSVKGIASHILGDDLSLLSRQRDGATQGLILVAEKMPGVDFRTLLDTFNDQWVEASRFMSVPLLVEMLRLSGEWSLSYYSDVDPMLPGEPVPLFLPAPGEPSPFWQAIVREYLERWAHHSQMRRAVGQQSLADAPFVEAGVRIVAAAAEAPATETDDVWAVGPLELGSAQQTADILTLAHTEDEVRTLVQGPDELVAQFAARVARRTEE